MDPLLRQVGDLLLGAVPTAVIFLLLYAIYTTLVGNPLRRTLDERRKRTEGAVLKARADIAAAEAKTQDYEQRLREARLVIFKAQEVRRQAAQKARAEAVAAARERAQQQIREARTAIGNDIATARQSLQAESESLASEIIRTILKPTGAASAAGGHA
jgi:F-type H+-transporting ATPase subunit b